MAENNLFPNAFPRKVYCSPQYSYIRADGVHGWNLAIMEDQEPYRRDTCLKMVTAYNEYDQLKEDNKVLRDLCNELKDQLDMCRREMVGEGWDIRGTYNTSRRVYKYTLEAIEKANNILSPYNTENNG